MGTGTPLYGDRAPTIGQYVVIAGSALLDNERTLTGTSNQIVVTDNGAGSTVVLSTPQNIHTGASPTFAGMTLTAAANISLTNTVAAGESLIDCHIIQGDDDAMTGTLRGAYITASSGDEVTTGTIRGVEMKARAGYPGETGANVNVLEGFSVSSDAKTYDVTTHRGGEIILDGGAGTSTLAVGLRIANNFQANRATTSYGLQIYRDSFDYTADIQLSSGGLIGGSGGDLFITSIGRVGIGTAAPTRSLEIDAGAVAVGLRIESVNAAGAGFELTESGDEQFQFLSGVSGEAVFRTPNNIGSMRTIIALGKGAVANTVEFPHGDVYCTGGKVGVGISASLLGKTHIDQSSTTAAIPVLFLDQGDVSEQCIEFSSDATDRDVHLFTVDVTGTPAMDWLETPDIFSLNKGLDITAGALSFNTLALTAEGPATALDVSGVNAIFIDTTDNDVGLSGTINGVDGQLLHIAVHDATNTTTIFDAAATGNQDFYCHAGGDEVMDEKGGWTFINMGGDHWHDLGHAKHVAA